MIVLTIRTDKPEAELGLYDGDRQLAYESWLAHRQLAETIHQKIANLLSSQQRLLADVRGIVCFQGPGSFTGLRIGLTVGNALAMGLGVPIVAAQDPEWVASGLAKLHAGMQEFPVMPFYGADVHITQQKK